MILLGEGGIDGHELGDVILAVVGRESDAGKGYGGVGGLELLDDAGEVGLGLFEGKAAESVVATELYDDDAAGMAGEAGEEAVEAFEAVLGGVAADAGVDDAIVVALGVEQWLELVGVALAGVGAVAGGEGVAEADEEGSRVVF